MELYDALESNGSYSKTEITQRVDKYRDKLMQVCVEFSAVGRVINTAQGGSLDSS